MASATSQRSAEVSRKTKETAIAVAVEIDGTGRFDIATGVGFFDHMLEQLSRHSLIDMTVKAKGDLHIDDHHTVEDTGIALGQAIAKALGERRGITRYASLDLAMDETLTHAAVDVSGRPFLVWNVTFSSPKVGTLTCQIRYGRSDASSATRVSVSSIGTCTEAKRRMPRRSPNAL